MKKIKLPRYILWIGYNAIIFLLLMTLLRLALMLAFKVPEGSKNVIGKSLILGIRYDLRMVCIASLIFFVLGCIPPLHPLDKKWGKRISFWIWGVIILVFSFFYVVDFANYAYLSQRLTAGLLNYLYDARISMSMVWQTYHVGWILAALIVVVIGLLGLVKLSYNKVLSEPRPTSKPARIIWSIIFFLLLGWGVFGRAGQFPLRWSDAYSLGDDYAANLALNPFQSFFSSLNFRHSGFEKDKVEAAYPFMAKYLGIDPGSAPLTYKRTVSPDSTAQQGISNVVLVICESFSGYKSSMYGNPLNTTPYFNQLCKEGVFFDHCFTPTYGTARGVWATLTGMPDVELNTTASRNPGAVDQHILMNDFKNHEKFYFIGGSASWANIRGFLTNNIQGLHLYEQDDYDAPKIDVWGVSDKNMMLGANKVLAKQDKPFFAVLQTADNHRPYTIPKEDQQEFKIIKVPADSLKKYGFATLDEFNAFRYTDYCFEKFMEAAKKEKYFNNTLFVFIGDHGIRGDASSMMPAVFTEQGLTNEHVPLLFYSPAFVKPKRISYLASQVDVLPTIAGLCNIPYVNTALGVDLLNDKRILADNGKSNCTFIFEPDSRRIGIIHDDLYYSYGLQKGGPDQISSIKNNDKVELTDSLRNKYRALSDAFYHTARYMLFNNKKPLQ
ncbi:LTA synthase family protein [Danxiaibacter flavus]|uniref:LTA synthase family protein n=1 Tax=Danxiaibacter flavus TaxID=3049108 RepID=A0ABV3ZL15_9BACT|nr:LTA synthase family protein [Chitinophagaceae bacterium DXS]